MQLGWTSMAGVGLRLANAALVVACLVTAGQLGFSVYFAPSPDVVVDNGGGNGVEPRNFLREAEKLLAANLFGIPLAGRPDSGHRDAPTTELDLVLKGIMFTERPADSRAIIESAGRQAAYRLHAEVPGGASLEAMYSDRVMLRRDGGFEVLWLTPESQPATADPEPAMSSVDFRGNESMANQLARIRSEFLADPGHLASQLRIVPVASRQGLEGVRLLPSGQDTGLLGRVGLHRDDVILAVNGVRIDSASRGLEVLRGLLDANEVSVRVRRDGKPYMLKYRIAQNG